MTEKVKPLCPKCGLDYDNPDEKCNRVAGWLARWVRKPVFVPVPTDEQQGLPEETTVEPEPPTDGLIRHP